MNKCPKLLARISRTQTPGTLKVDGKNSRSSQACRHFARLRKCVIGDQGKETCKYEPSGEV